MTPEDEVVLQQLVYASVMDRTFLSMFTEKEREDLLVKLGPYRKATLEEEKRKIEEELSTIPAAVVP